MKKRAMTLVIVMISLMLSIFIRVDYNIAGLFLILVLYLARERFWLKMLLGCCTDGSELGRYDLAVMCGLDVPEAKLENLSKTGSTFLIKCFDRDGEKRIHFASAMTLLGKNDDASAADRG